MSSGLTRQYDPGQVIFTVGAQTASGVAKGTFIEADRYVNAAEMDVGSDGEVTLVISQNHSGSWKLTLQQSSPMNDYLSSLADALEQRNLGVAIVACTLKDNNGTLISRGKQCWVKKKAKAGFADTAESREWIIETGYMDYSVGGESTL